jgi:hypothetical protein
MATEVFRSATCDTQCDVDCSDDSKSDHRTDSAFCVGDGQQFVEKVVRCTWFEPR